MDLHGDLGKATLIPKPLSPQCIFYLQLLKQAAKSITQSSKCLRFQALELGGLRFGVSILICSGERPHEHHGLVY